MQHRVPSPRELAMHTQTIIQNALIKKKLEEQRENFRKRQEQQQHHQQQQHKHQTHPNAPSPVNSPAKQTLSPTPLAFTPTSVLRKMTAEKEPEGANQSFQQVEIIIASASANQALPKFNNSSVAIQSSRNYTSHKNNNHQSPKEKKWNGIVSKGQVNNKNGGNKNFAPTNNKMSPKKKAPRSKNNNSHSTGNNNDTNNNDPSSIDKNNESLKNCPDGKNSDSSSSSNTKILDSDPKVSDMKNISSDQILNIDSKSDIPNKIMLDSDPSISTSVSKLSNFDSKVDNESEKNVSVSNEQSIVISNDIDSDPIPSVSTIPSAIDDNSMKTNIPIISGESKNKIIICEAQNSARRSSLDSLD